MDTLNLAHSKVEFYNRLLENFEFTCDGFGHSEGFAYYRELDKYKHAAAIKHAMVYLLHDFGYSQPLIHYLSGLSVAYVATALKRRSTRDSFLTDKIVDYTKSRMVDRDTLKVDADTLVNKLIDDVASMQRNLDATVKEIRTLESKLKTLFH